MQTVHEDHGHTHDNSHDHHDHDHEEHHGLFHDHVHTTNYETLDTEEGISAAKRSFYWLFVTAIFQLAVAFLSGSTALLADAAHNFGDALTAAPLWIAFHWGKKDPTSRFPYGLGDAEDLGGVAILFIMSASALYAGYESVMKLLYPQPINWAWMVAIMAIAGFAANAKAAQIRLTTGKKINSKSLQADGYHALADSWGSLAVVLGPLFVWIGYPWVDPAVGLVISFLILRIVCQSGIVIFTRLLGGVDNPELVSEIAIAIMESEEISEVVVDEVRCRWSGRRFFVDIKLLASTGLTIEKTDEIRGEIRHLLSHMSELGKQDWENSATIQFSARKA